MSGYSLDNRLINGTRPGNVADLASAWSYCDYLILVERMAAFADAPSLTLKLRGAMGDVLLDGASDAALNRDKCDWQHASAADYFLGTRPCILIGGVSNQICAPFALSCWQDGMGGLIVRMRLFGLAVDRGEAALLALLSAIRHRVIWRALGRDAHASVPERIAIGGVQKREIEGAEMLHPVTPLTVQIVFKSELNLGQGANQSLSDLFYSRLIARLSLMAPWMGIKLSDEALTAEPPPEPIDNANLPVSSDIPGKAGGHKRKSMVKLPDPFRLLVHTQSQLTAIKIGEVCGIGRGAVFGLGRYDAVHESDHG